MVRLEEMVKCTIVFFRSELISECQPHQFSSQTVALVPWAALHILGKHAVEGEIVIAASTWGKPCSSWKAMLRKIFVEVSLIPTNAFKLFFVLLSRQQ